MTEIKVFFPDTAPELTFVVIAALYKGEWLLVQKKGAETWETPGGHIEPGESAEAAARRELAEETGAIAAKLWQICPYGVGIDCSTTYGMLYLALVDSLGDLPLEYEIGERMAIPSLPDFISYPLTYPAIQPHLFARAYSWLEANRTEVYFIRHAKSDFNIHEDAIRPLTDAGHRAALELVDKLEDIPFDAVYSSPYRRTMDTVSPLAKARGLDIAEVYDFREREYGEWLEDDTFYAEVKRRWADFSYAEGGGESLDTVQRRNIAALKLLLERERGKTIAIGTHGTALSTILNYYFPEFDLDDFMDIIDINPYIIRLDFLEDALIGAAKVDHS